MHCRWFTVYTGAISISINMNVSVLAGFEVFYARKVVLKSDRAFEMLSTMNSGKPRVSIRYCSQCRFVLCATWLSQELLFTFGQELGELALVPDTGGVFRVYLNEELLFCRKEQGRFPESKELKQLIRDRVDPDKSLGHSDR